MKRETSLLLLLLAMGGCAPVEKYTLATAPEFMTTRASAFYRHGPQQPGAPDTLQPQTLVRVLARDPGYTFAQLADGRTGYLATEDLRKAPPAGRAVTEAELFPEKILALTPLPEPDLTMPVAEIPKGDPSRSPR